MELGEDPQRLGDWLRELRSEAPGEAWAAFIDHYSPIIQQVIALFERDPDAVADCFLFACEQLCNNHFRRLQQFRPDGAASFPTWLRAVVRRLCIDWHRKEFGRSRIFECIGQLSRIDQAVFRAIYQDGTRQEEVVASLRGRFPQFTQKELDESLRRIRQSLSPRQLWLLSTRKPKLTSLNDVFTDDRGLIGEQIRDLAPDPETLAAELQQRVALDRALAGLDASDRLFIRLRYEQELTLEQVARLTGLPDPQTADRRIKQILGGLRKSIGKRQPASV